jgi:hypothetical protein
MAINLKDLFNAVIASLIIGFFGFLFIRANAINNKPSYEYVDRKDEELRKEIKEEQKLIDARNEKAHDELRAQYIRELQNLKEDINKVYNLRK